jgi:hypothetical protein
VHPFLSSSTPPSPYHVGGSSGDLNLILRC